MTKIDGGFKTNCFRAGSELNLLLLQAFKATLCFMQFWSFKIANNAYSIYNYNKIESLNYIR